ncbi:hypothetical protein KQI88_15165 [Alkaliphilus sp. MSJ-5]|uniref:Uncharacterized protein n=1 Tax=Alkaliphilus flagellatus TaxID=2841507 RepID=A0ABS6G813_9FIRM|nr:hypothetical protein [Alkaliphilus flagellatus]MBU5677758.1 hypothetical protein [Alkaliphilus flagellatus]
MKKIKGINLIKMSVLVLTGFTLATLILNISVSYQTYRGSEDSLIGLFAILLGTVLGVIARVGLTLLFWSSYNIKYPNEKFNEKIGKKIIAYFLFMTALIGLSLSRGTLLIFIICTLLIALKEQKKLAVE